jgi:hypothetical protein
MAIGKAGAYATVEGPKVDFGDIALNAQKIQQADLDRAKSMIPEKQKEREVSPYEAQVSSSGVGAFDYTINNLVKKSVDVANQARQTGDNATFSRADMAVKTYKNSTEIAKEGYKYFTERLREGKVSGLDKDKIENVLSLNDVSSVVAEVSDEGEVLFSFLDKEKNEDGTVKTKKVRFGDKYVDKINANDISNFMTDVLEPVDVLTEAKKFAQNTGANKTSVENGNVTVAKTEYTKENLDLLRDSISSKIKSDTDFFEDVWYQSNPSKNNVRKLPSEYTEEDYKQAEDFLYDQTRRNFDSSYTKSVDEPTRITINNGKTEDNNYVTNNAAIVKGKLGGKQTNLGYVLSIQSNKKVNIGGVDSTVQGAGYDKNSNRFYISYYTPVSYGESGGGTSTSSKRRELQFIWLNGEESDVSLANTVIPNLNRKDSKGNIISYSDVGELITDIKSRDPKGMFFSPKKTSKKLTVAEQMRLAAKKGK